MKGIEMFTDERNADSAKALCWRKAQEAGTRFVDLYTFPHIGSQEFKDAEEAHERTLRDYGKASTRLRELRNRPLWKRILDNLV